MAYIFVLAWVQLFLSAVVWAAGPGQAPTWDEFQYYCHKHRVNAAYTHIPLPPIGQVVFAPTKALRATQVEFGFASFNRKLAKSLSLERETAEHFKKTSEWQFPKDEDHDFGRSFFPKRKALRVFYYRGELYMPDGHHRALVATYIGSENVPISVIADKSNLSPEEFFRFLEEGGHSFFEDAWGNPVAPVDLCDMKDNPNLELARIVIGHVKVTFENHKMLLDDLRGSAVVVGIKADNDISFAEMYAAHAFTRRRKKWDGRRDYTLSELQTFLNDLKAESNFPRSRLNELMLFDHPVPLNEIPARYKPLIFQHMRGLGINVAGLPDYPNFELAHHLLADLEVSFRKKGVSIERAEGPKWVIGGKTRYDSPGLEAAMANAFDAAGLFWEGEKPSPKDLPAFLEVLHNSQLDAPVLLFPNPVKSEDIPGHHGNLMLDHLKTIGCEEALRIGHKETP